MSFQEKTNVKQAVPFFWVHDIEKSIRYYMDGIGFELTNNWTDGGKMRWCWLQMGGAALMLQEFWKEGHHANLPKNELGERLGQGVSIYFICDDAIAIYNEVTPRGIKASEPSVGNNMWVTGIIDPDGYKLYFESATDAPEETKYSEWKKGKIKT